MAERVLVTGATGFLGGAVLRRLGKDGVGQGRNEARCKDLAKEDLNCVSWNLPNPAPDHPAFEDVTAVVHCAGLSAPFGSRAWFHDANVLGTQAVIDFARARGVSRFVFVSSPSIYFALADQLNVSENSALPPPFTEYARSKIEAEARVRAAPDIGPVIIRPRGIYGSGDTALLPRLLKAAQSRPLPRFRDGRAAIDLTHVDDVVDAVMAALRASPSAQGRAFNISGGEVLPVSEIVGLACERANVTPRWRNVPLGPALLVARSLETLALASPGQKEPAITRYALGLFAFEQSLNITRARSELHWTPKISFAEGLKRTFGEGA